MTICSILSKIIHQSSIQLNRFVIQEVLQLNKTMRLPQPIASKSSRALEKQFRKKMMD